MKNENSGTLPDTHFKKIVWRLNKALGWVPGLLGKSKSGGN